MMSSIPFARSLRRSYLAQRWGNALSLLAIGAGLLLLVAQAAWSWWPRLVLDGPAVWLPSEGWVRIERGQCKGDYAEVRLVRINGKLRATCV